MSYTNPSAIYPSNQQQHITAGSWTTSHDQGLFYSPFEGSIPDARTGGVTTITNLPAAGQVAIDITVEKTRWTRSDLWFSEASIDANGRMSVRFVNGAYSATYAGYPAYNKVAGTGQTNNTQGAASLVTDTISGANFNFPGGLGGAAPLSDYVAGDGPFKASVSNNGSIYWSYKSYQDTTEAIPAGTRNINIKVPSTMKKVVATLGGQSYTVVGGATKQIPVTNETSVVLRPYMATADSGSYQIEFLGGGDTHNSTDWELSLSSELKVGQKNMLRQNLVDTNKTLNSGYATDSNGLFAWEESAAGIQVRGKGGDGVVTSPSDTRTYAWSGELPLVYKNLNGTSPRTPAFMPSIISNDIWRWPGYYPRFSHSGVDIYSFTSIEADIDPNQRANFGGRSKVTITNVPNYAGWGETWTAGREDRELGNCLKASLVKAWVDANGYFWVRYSGVFWDSYPNVVFDYGGPASYAVSGGSVTAGSSGNGAASTVVGVTGTPNLNFPGGVSGAAAAMSDWIDLGPGPLNANFVNSGSIEYRSYKVNSITETIPAGATEVTVSVDPEKVRQFTIEYDGKQTTTIVQQGTGPAILASQIVSFNVGISKTVVVNVLMRDNHTDSRVTFTYYDSGDTVFSNPLRRSIDDQVNLKVWGLSGLSPLTKYYVRARHRGAISGISDWSDVVAFTTGDGVTAAKQVQTSYLTERMTSHMSTNATLEGTRNLTNWQTLRYPNSIPGFEGNIDNFEVNVPASTQIEYGLVPEIVGTHKTTGESVTLVLTSYRDVQPDANTIWRYLKYVGTVASLNKTVECEYGMTVYLNQAQINFLTGQYTTTGAGHLTDVSTSDETPVKSNIAFMAMHGITDVVPPATVTGDQTDVTVALNNPMYVKKTGNVAWQRLSGDVAVWQASVVVSRDVLELSADNGFLAKYKFANATTSVEFSAVAETTWYEVRSGVRWQMAKYTTTDGTSSAVYGYPTSDHSTIYTEMNFVRTINNVTTYPGTKLVRFEHAATGAYLDYEYVVTYGQKLTQVMTSADSVSVNALTSFYTTGMTDVANNLAP